MTAGIGFPDKKVIADLTAKMFLEVGAVQFMADKPFIFTSGWASPVYTDCRRLISFPRVRRTLIDFGASIVLRDAGFEQFDVVAGGETAGIPFAAWMSDALGLPMLYVRKKAKGFGRNAQIEGHFAEGERILLVEDLTTDGRSKVNFCNALRRAGATVDHIFVLFFYDIYPEGRKILADLGITMHALATWWDVLRVAKEEMEVMGFRVAPGKLVGASPAVSNRIAEDFPDPDAFVPERYLEPRSEDRANPWTWIPFGAGRHRCVGAPFAMMQLKAIFSVLLRHWDFELAQPSESYRNDHSKMVVQLAQPCVAKFRPRAVPDGAP